MSDGRRVLPCPFCGGAVNVREVPNPFSKKGRGYFIGCGKKGCPVCAFTKTRKSKREVIEEWNTRYLKGD